MSAALAPWPFLVGGATAVEVALLLDGDVVEQRYLWRGGEATEARDAAGLPRVRLGYAGFELLIHGVCDGVVSVGARSVTLRELALCGVAALPIGPETTAWLRVGGTELRVSGTTSPRKLPLAPVRSARELATLAAGALAGLVCAIGLVATMAAPPRMADWEVQYRAWLLRLGQPREGGVTRFYEVTQPGPRPPSAAATGGRLPATDLPPAKTAQPRTRPAATRKPAAAKARATTAAQSDDGPAATTASAPGPAAAATRRSTAAGRSMAVTELLSKDGPTRGGVALVADAAAASSERARASGLLGQLAHWRAGFLGDERAFGNVDVARSDRRIADGSASAGSANELGEVGGKGTNGSGNDRGGASGGGDVSGDVSGASGGDVSGDSIGDVGGAGGLGLDGSGAGGGGADETSGLGLAGFGGGGVSDDETIDLGDLGTIGHGSGGGYGEGFVRCGGLRGHFAAAVPTIAGAATIHGSCDGDAIRRVVRAHVNEVRFCYERALQARPQLSGRVLAQFDIAPDGSAGDAAIAASSVDDPAVAGCVAGAIRRWQFPRCAAAVSYPFVFVPTGD